MTEYSDEEVQAILHKALESGDTSLGLTHEELADVAAQVGISTDQLELAAEQVRLEKADLSDDEEAAHAVQVRKKRRRRGWLRHFFTYGVVITGLAALDWVTGGGLTWWFYPAVGWGIAVGLQAGSVLFADDEAEHERQLRRIRRRRARQQKEEERARKKQARGSTASSIESALEQGVALLLTTAAEKLAAKLESGTPADTDFGRFVAKKRGVPTRVAGQRSDARRPGVRVEDEAESVELETARPDRQREAER